MQDLIVDQFVIGVKHHDMHYEVEKVISITHMKDIIIVKTENGIVLYTPGDFIRILATPIAKPKVKKVLRGFDGDILEEIYE